MSDGASALFWMDMTPLPWRKRLRLYCSWPYIRQTRLLLPLTGWWLNHGR